MTRHARRLWKLLFALFAACTLASLIGWSVLLTSFCSHPRKALPETQQVIVYNCHGMTVFISPLQEALRQWLIPLGMLFLLLSLVAGAMVLLARVKVRIDVQIHPTDRRDKSPHRESGA